jgi:tetratricopeptide (TPR) repeat protein
VALGRQSRDKRLVAHAHSNRATLLTLDARVDDALMDLEEAIAIDRAIGDRRHEGRCIAGRAVVLLDNRGEHARAEADFKEALAILREVGDLGYQAHVLGYLASLCSEHGEVAEGRRYLEEALDIRRALGSRREIMTLLGQRGIFQDLEGELSQARASYVETIVQARAVADRRYQGYYLYYLARLDLEQGRLEESRRSVGEAIALLERVRDARYSIFARATSTAERALSGAIADAERELAALRAARDRMADDHLGSIVTLADAFVARARGDGARALALRSAADVRASDDVRLLARAFDCTMAIQPPT